MSKEIPELAITPLELWDRVQQKLGETRQLGAPTSRMNHVTSPVSGLLRCGACGSCMSICAQVKKNGATYRSFACSANPDEGP